MSFVNIIGIGFGVPDEMTELSISIVDRDAIVTWVRKKTGTPVIRLQSKESAEEFLKKDQTFVIGLFKNFEVRQMRDVTKCVIFRFFFT